MSMLAEIFAHKRIEVERAKATTPLDELKSRSRDVGETRGFRNSLLDAKPPIALIAEVKKASPSEGLIRPDFEPVEIARTYELGGATCLSVLTDEKYFQGHPSYLSAIRDAVDLPLLRKDFIFDAYQLYQARAWGADAVLLIASFWSRPETKSMALTPVIALHDEARDLGLDILVEVHDEAETDLALGIGADLIGVNNRDLSTFQTDLATSERLVPKIAPHAVAVSESAIATPTDVNRVKKAGASAILVGTTLCKSMDIASAMSELLAGVE